MPPVINTEECIACGQCVDACQSDVFCGTEPGEVAEVTYPEECWHCSACVFSCPVEGAIQIRVPLPMMMLFRPPVIDRL